MKLLAHNNWQDGFLDYHRGASTFRIAVRAWKDLEKLEGLYFVRSKKIRAAWNYLHEVGPRSLFHKVRSRLQERVRNEKYVSCGIGVVLEAPEGNPFTQGKVVMFFSPIGVCAERIVAQPEFVFPIAHESMASLPQNAILYHAPDQNEKTENRFWQTIRGWSAHAGIPISEGITRVIEEGVARVLEATDWKNARALPAEHSSPIQETSEAPVVRAHKEKKRAVLFGYGNFAKVIILPNVKRYLSVEKIHELDPTQIPVRRAARWDTNPMPRQDEMYDAMLIASYHHMHASQAIWGLERNMQLAIEKPIATTEADLQKLLETAERCKGKIYTGFHKRYLPFNDLIHRDLGIKRGDPFSYHSIVYEVALPELHWYRWPNSRSRLLTDGCHWIDHFLYLNDFAKPAAHDIFIAPDGTVNCSIVLENDAHFTMALTTQGSSRIGVQDYIEIRANGATIRMINNALYSAEDAHRIFRKEKINRIFCYNEMYRQISRNMFYDRPGESIQSLRVSGGIALELDQKIASRKTIA